MFLHVALSLNPPPTVSRPTAAGFGCSSAHTVPRAPCQALPPLRHGYLGVLKGNTPRKTFLVFPSPHACSPHAFFLLPVHRAAQPSICCPKATCLPGDTRLAVAGGGVCARCSLRTPCPVSPSSDHSAPRLAAGSALSAKQRPLPWAQRGGEIHFSSVTEATESEPTPRARSIESAGKHPRRESLTQQEPRGGPKQNKSEREKPKWSA